MIEQTHYGYRSEAVIAGTARHLKIILHYSLGDDKHPLSVDFFEFCGDYGGVLNIDRSLQVSEKEWGSLVVEVASFLQEVDRERIERINSGE